MGWKNPVTDFLAPIGTDHVSFYSERVRQRQRGLSGASGKGDLKTHIITTPCWDIVLHKLYEKESYPRDMFNLSLALFDLAKTPEKTREEDDDGLAMK